MKENSFFLTFSPLFVGNLLEGWLANVRKNDVDVEDLKNEVYLQHSSGKAHEAPWVHRRQNEPRAHPSANILYSITSVFPLSM